jgi:hypothetical protein
MSLEPTHTSFTKLNDAWNAEAGAPCPEVRIEAHTLVLTFYLNPWVFRGVRLGDCGELSFPDCWRYRLGETNDEGWWRGQCRFSRRAPEWGEFYEVEGDLRLDRLPSNSWVVLADPPQDGTRHFLFYFKDETFECDASGWSFRVLPAIGDVTVGWEGVTLPSGSSVLVAPPRSKRSDAPLVADSVKRQTGPSPLSSWIPRFVRRRFRAPRRLWG